eukprot:scaffold649272_cov47-Prasinocladus_malaysianus.AAC.1
MAGCHSLIEVQNQLLGDPIEMAAIGAIKWLYKPSAQKAFPAPPPATPPSPGPGSQAPMYVCPLRPFNTP